MRVDLQESPFAPIKASMRPDRPFFIRELVYHPDIGMPDKFSDFVVVDIGGHVIPRENWNRVRIKPEADIVLTISIVPHGQNPLALLATIATIAAVAAIGAFGLPFLGIAAGTFGASLFAAGVGIVGQLVARALTSPPVLANDSSAAGNQKVEAGVSGNTPVLNDTLPGVLGKIGFSPSILLPPYTKLVNGSTIVYAVVGHEGRCKVEGLLFNSLTTDQIAGLQYEVREGDPGDLPRTIATETTIDKKMSQLLSTFDTQNVQFPDRLVHQPLDTNDLPQWHGIRTAGKCDDFTIRLMSPSGFSDSGGALSVVMVPLRVQLRKKGSLVWRNLPEVHIQDVRHGTGSFKCEIRCKFQKLSDAGVGGRLWGYNTNWNVYAVTNVAGRTQTFQYDSDAYFKRTVDANFYLGTGQSGFLATATGLVTGGITYSASSNNAQAYLPFDSDPGGGSQTFWTSANPDADPSFGFDLGAGNAQTLKSYTLWGSQNNLAVFPKQWTFEGSNNNVNWTILDTVDTSGSPTFFNHCQVANPGSYRYYRWHFPSTATLGFTPRITGARVYTLDAVCSALPVELVASEAGAPMVHSGLTTEVRCTNAAIDQDGVTFYLDPASWDNSDEYEIQIKRGAATPSGGLSENAYAFGQGGYSAGYGPNVGLFDYLLSGGIYYSPFGYYYRSDLQIDLIQTHEAVAPFDPTGICLIAFSVPDATIDSVYAVFTRYAPIWDGNVWTEVMQPTSNPAALYRQLLLGGCNSDPTPGEIIDEDELVDWYNNCVTNDYQCNAVVQGANIRDVKQLIASAGYGSPRDSAFYGVVQDRDTSSVISTIAITPMNSKDQGTGIDIATVPHAIIANFADETNNYEQGSVTVYRDGFTVDNAKDYQAVTYQGTTNSAKAAARAAYDLKALHSRQIRYKRQVGIIGRRLKRGLVVKLGDEVLDRNQCYGRVKSVQRDGGNIVGVTLDNIIPWSLGQDIEGVEDFGSLTDVLNPSQPMGLVFEHDPDNEHQVTNVSDSNVITFSSGFADEFDDDGKSIYQRGLMVVTGNMSAVGRRTIVMSVVPSGIETFDVELADEANELFAA